MIFFLNILSKHFFSTLDSTIILCFCILSRFYASSLSISCKIPSNAFNCLFFFHASSFQEPERSPNPLTLFAIRETSKPGFPWKTKSSVAGRYKERIVIVVRPETLAFCFISWWRKRLLHFQERRRVIKPCPRRAHRCGEFSGKMTLCVLTRQTLKGRSLGVRSRNNASFRYRRFKSKISFAHWHLSTDKSFRDKNEGRHVRALFTC